MNVQVSTKLILCLSPGRETENLFGVALTASLSSTHTSLRQFTGVAPEDGAFEPYCKAIIQPRATSVGQNPYLFQD